MHLHEIIIEGFKSYAQRTTVGPFDERFNAITGLNGSGKSNILDSICFVLGISNLTQVRAGNLQELVYKQGQAGVTKATVTIVFDNMDKKSSPVGYEDSDQITVTRQVIIGGRNKYLINGVNAQQQRVQNLFHSVQLNVNNPHFLIMQGRITKVLNMKPPEVLSMIEEAAGTRMFENKKEAAIKTIEKKEKKVEEINKVLNEEITPTLEKLRKERSVYLEYQKTQTECDQLARFVIAFDYSNADRAVHESTSELQQAKEETERLKLTSRNKESKAIDLEQTIAVLAHKRDQESGGSLQDLDRHVADLSKELVKANSAATNRKEVLESERKGKASLLKARKDLDAAIVAKVGEKDSATAALQAAKQESDQATQQVEQLQRRAHGFSSDNGTGRVKTFADELMEAKQDATAAVTEQKEAKIKIAHSQSELVKKEKDTKATEKEYSKVQTELEQCNASIASFEAKLAEANVDPKRESELGAAKAKEQAIVTELKDKCDALSAKVAALNFNYSDPEPNFDRSTVKGLVATLVTVDKPQVNATALEITAGGRLYNVVVDRDSTAQKLLSNGRLKKRVTIIPLNKIQGSRLPQDKVKLAEREVGKENVSLALSLVGYDEELEAAMTYVFGSTLVCKTLEMARRITFNNNIRARTVTLDGDVCEASGTLTGGSTTPASSSVLNQLAELQTLREQLQTAEARLKKITEELAALRAANERTSKTSRDLDLARHQSTLLQKRLQQNSHHAVLEEITRLRAEIARLEQVLVDAAAREKAANARSVRIEGDMQSFNSKHNSEVKKAEAEISKAKTAATKAAEAAKTKQGQLEMIELELTELQKELAQAIEQLAQSEQAIEAAAQEVEQAETTLAAKREAYDAAKLDLQRKKEKISATDSEIAALTREAEACRKACTDADIDLKKVQHNVTQMQQTLKEATKLVERLLTKHEWIATEKAFFGAKNMPYDFSEQDPEAARRRLLKLEETQQKLQKSINMKVLNMFGKAEQEYNDLMKKKKIVENDKSKIEAAIQELDVKKNEALKKTFEQVNRDFGSIFSTLLPGTNAKLSPPEGQSVLSGLEVKVAFGGVWKESLTELSGGQRSLVALSLILSLLLFKPAPMYILDEVDAALDLSHTQNIGNMLRTHFSQSQFIVVSLKDGMFNNANVLFKTKFVDGVSTVSRTVQLQKQLPRAQQQNRGFKPVPAIASGSNTTSAPAATSAETDDLLNDSEEDDDENMPKNKGKGAAKPRSKATGASQNRAAAMRL
ncbi:hypothetical protein CAOG_00350 [Capsaspora owczarzaki ATCC 30864]|uniref:Structural maintenance of chromosomes protein n=1 Tax=Capsaspora owczarzaki (strain ATCC 30864) TaxID=595528 RepID=A0A0D2WGY2_CAPO3|nr:hypothetical protein CAOG_00350 [Capsaspora owczarzaki ATCC 30864]KJE88760.1 hypothetical protein CAOG_000350 [Capsaspora owczarzaki ATCC 30864]|eukprot:XP_004365221.1 hypothetical protein CAOG_00350 [Capsaspora owczarzaki ATCC 30864]